MEFKMFEGPQRVLTPSEYEALGYQLVTDAPDSFESGSYSSFGIDLNPFDFAYRSETKEEAVIDSILFIGKITLAYASGGIWVAASTAWTTSARHLINE